MGNFAQVFDAVQSEYGWTDDVVLDLPLIRLRQISDTIAQRRWLATRVEEGLVEWQTKTLASFISSTAMSVKGQRQLHAAVRRLRIRDDAEAVPSRENTPSNEGWTPDMIPPVDKDPRFRSLPSFEGAARMLAQGIEAVKP